MSTPSAPPRLPGLEHVQRLGSGGFADVHLYRQQLPKMLVAVKVLRTAVGDQREQFVDEANTMAELAEHPYIVTIFRADTTEEGQPYLVMSYHPKPNLAARARGNPLSVAEALRTGVQLASAVETAHRAGVLHRDIKPANVLMSSYGTPVLADFGIAGRAATLDQEAEVGVSIAWAPPEVLRGDSNGSVAADIYSLTATIWYLLAGRTPFEDVGGDNSERAMLTRATREPPRRTGRDDVPESLERLLQQGLAKDPALRPRSAMALATDLQQIEQELRLSRTEVVLLDREHEALHTVTGHPTTIRPASGLSGERAADLEPYPEQPVADEPATALRPASGRRDGGDPSEAVTALPGAVPADGDQEADPAAATGPVRTWTTDPLPASGTGEGGTPGSTTGSGPAGGRRRWPLVLVAALLVPLIVATGFWVASRVVGGGGETTSPPVAGGDSSTPGPTDGTGPSGSGTTPGGGTTDASVDPCVVGRWEVVEYREESDVGTATGLERDMTVTKDGRMTVVYDEAALTGTGVVLDGTVVYQIGTKDGQMTFSIVRNDVITKMGGIEANLEMGTNPVDYTCSGDRFTQTKTGFKAVMERVRG